MHLIQILKESNFQGYVDLESEVVEDQIILAYLSELNRLIKS